MSPAAFQPSPRLEFDDNDSPTITLPPPIPQRGHQRSRTTADVPSLFSRSLSVSPTRSSALLSFHSSRSTSPERSGSASTHSALTRANSPVKSKNGTVGKLASWFEGSSEPVNLSIVPSPNKEKPEPFYSIDSVTGSAMNSHDNLTQRPSKRLSRSQSVANSSMFSFFKRPAAQAPVKANQDDLVQLDISEALLPNGPPAEFTPETFKALQEAAEELLKKFQMSYAENLGALRQITSEKNIQSDELEACQTRNDHLKMQLLEMAERAAEQERAIAGLRLQLDKHQQSIRMITEDEPPSPRSYRRSRMSDCSSSGDSLTDSDMSSAVSIFSEVESIRTPSTSVAASPIMKHALMRSPTLTMAPAACAQATSILVPDCSNCHGVPAAEAWDVIGIMKMESHALKQRVSELENAQDAALDFLSGLNM